MDNLASINLLVIGLTVFIYIVSKIVKKDTLK